MYCFYAGWVVVPNDSRDPEANTLKMWQRRLREFTKQRYIHSFIQPVTVCNNYCAKYFARTCTNHCDDHYLIAICQYRRFLFLHIQGMKRGLWLNNKEWMAPWWSSFSMTPRSRHSAASTSDLPRSPSLPCSASSPSACHNPRRRQSSLEKDQLCLC